MFLRIEIFGVAGAQLDAVEYGNGGLKGVGQLPFVLPPERGGFLGHGGIDPQYLETAQQRHSFPFPVLIQTSQNLGIAIVLCR